MKCLLILGSNSDVGQACAYKFAEQGFDLLLAARKIDDYQKRLAYDISIRYNVKTTNVCFDASGFSEHQLFYDSLGSKPDVVISAFGYLGNHEKALVDFNEAANIIAANYTGNVSILNIIANEMEARKSGSIICISSVAGERGKKANYIYGSAKAALTAYLSGLRNRLSEKNVQVTTVIPGFIRTKMIAGLTTPNAITATPIDVSSAIWNAYKKKKDVVYVLPVWWLIMLIIKMIPEKLYKRLSL